MSGGMGTTSVLLAVVGLWVHVLPQASAGTYEEWIHTIEVAGIQRMYTQEMQKEFLLVAANCNAEENKQKLASSMATYNQNMIDLRFGNASEKIVAAYNEYIEKDLNYLWDRWVPLRALLASQVDTIFDGTGVSNRSALEEMSYISKPSIDLWDETLRLMTEAAWYDGVPTNGLVLDVAERQVMLVHKMGKEMLKVGLDVNALDNIVNLQATKELFEASHTGIIQGASWAGVPPLRNVCTLNQMREVTYYFEKMVPTILEVFAARTEEESVIRASDSIKNISLLSDPLIKSMKAAVEMYLYEPNTSTCVDPRDLSDDNWRTAILAAEDQNFFCAQAAALFMQVVLGFAVSASKVELTVLLDTASQSLQDLVEGDRSRGLVAPPKQNVVNRLVAVQSTWRDLDLVLTDSVRADVIVPTTVSEVARLADEVLFDMIAAVDKYVEAAEEAETPVPVYALDLAGRQRTYVQKMAKETGLIGYGYNVEYNWGGLNSSRDTFMKHHWKLLEGAAATGSHPAVPMTTEVCVVQIMKEIADKFGDFEEAALSVANGNLADMQQLTQLNPEIIALLDIAAGWFGDPRDKTCEASVLTGVEWQGLINEVGSMRAMSQEAAGDYLLSQNRNGTSTQDGLLNTKARIESSLKRMKFGSRLPNVPAPTTQMILDDLLNLLMPAVDDFLSALKGEDTAKVLETSNALLEVTENLKSQYLAGAASSELSVTRYDAISRQVMLVQKMLKDALVVVYQAGDGNVSSRETLQSTIDDFAAMHLALKEGGRGMEPVILSREDILEQWALIDAAWAGLQPLLSTTNPLDVPEMAAAANALEVELLAAIPLYAIPDNPKPPELLWSALAYIGISCFVVGVCCAACCVLYSAHRRRKKEAAEAASTDAVIPPMV